MTNKSQQFETLLIAHEKLVLQGLTEAMKSADPARIIPLASADILASRASLLRLLA